MNLHAENTEYANSTTLCVFIAPICYIMTRRGRLFLNCFLWPKATFWFLSEERETVGNYFSCLFAYLFWKVQKSSWNLKEIPELFLAKHVRNLKDWFVLVLQIPFPFKTNAFRKWFFPFTFLTQEINFSDNPNEKEKTFLITGLSLSCRSSLITNLCLCLLLLTSLARLIQSLVKRLMMTMGSLFQVFAGDRSQTWFLLPIPVAA